MHRRCTEADCCRSSLLLLKWAQPFSWIGRNQFPGEISVKSLLSSHQVGNLIKSSKNLGFIGLCHSPWQPWLGFHSKITFPFGKKCFVAPGSVAQWPSWAFDSRGRIGELEVCNLCQTHTHAHTHTHTHSLSWPTERSGDFCDYLDRRDPIFSLHHIRGTTVVSSYGWWC